MRAGGLLLEMPYVEYDEVGAACAECGRLFRSADDLEAHRKESHAPAPSAPGTKPRHPTLSCSLCSRKFYSIAALQDHTHHDHST
ncbi:MAG: C2H2-type zinc finger protein [Thermoplasmata archaeon]